MRTTVTLDGDTEALLRRRMRERGVSFKQALNLDRAVQVAADLEDDEVVRKLRVGE